MSIAVCVPTHNEPKATTEALIAEIKAVVGPDSYISRFNDAEGRGKGFALREAVKAVEVFNPDYYIFIDPDYYIFIDGDGDIDPRQIGTIVYHLDLGYDVVVGKKQIPVRWDRKIITMASRLWIKVLFGYKVDGQTGLKGFNYRPQWETDGWAHDMEILYKAKQMGKTMYEVPIEATVSSGKSIKDIVSTLVDSIKIRWKYARYEGEK